MADTLEVLLAKQAITEKLFSYCHGLDKFDRALANIWHDGGTANYEGIFDGTGDGFLDWVWPVHQGCEKTSHQVTNFLISVDGDQATSETYVTATLRMGDNDVVARGRYLDRWSCRNGVWGVDARRYEDDITQFLPKGSQQ
jgi:hypothetical protein